MNVKKKHHYRVDYNSISLDCGRGELIDKIVGAMDSMSLDFLASQAEASMKVSVSPQVRGCAYLITHMLKALLINPAFG